MDNSTLSSLASALVGFQASVAPIAKNHTVSTAKFSYTYAGLSDIWEAIRKPLADNKLAVTQAIEGGSDGYSTIVTTLWHESGEITSSAIDVPTAGKTPQEAGSLFTYYKRYALSALLGISTEEDDDASSSNTAPNPPSERRLAPAASKTQSPTTKQIDLIEDLAKRKGKDEEWFNNVLRKTKSTADASVVIDKLRELDDAIFDDNDNLNMVDA
ncbi:ERF family protein [Subtercola sp. RTI3]|uniref:ERF family protein n=1 Tax=Subtercola sp. RTI3 TaxID=3048639 RepID=UPI002B22826B|nr:ERF family protein [Subtercola sp. RTI3]MEA9985667.1 ERF family protein [Subtercola sp. RTI3]